MRIRRLFDRHVPADLAVAVACGARDIVDIEAVRAQRDLFGPVASDTTALRALGEVGGGRAGRIAAVRATARAHLWQQLPDGPPPVRIAGDLSLGKTVVLRIDATLVQAHSRKQQAAATYRKGFGHHPLGCWISNTGELAALMLRPGNANANTAADLITVLQQAIGQVPARWRDRLLVTSDGAGFSHELINWLTAQNHAADRHVEYSIGWPIDADTRAAITTVRKDCWLPAVDNLDGSVRDDLQVAEVTGLLRERLARGGWPARMRIFVRRRRLPAGQQHTLFDLDGYAYSAFATNTTSAMSIQLLDARHRGHARVEDDVRTTKDTGLAHLPSHCFAVNQAWCQAVAIAVDLLAWLRLVGASEATIGREEGTRSTPATNVATADLEPPIDPLPTSHPALPPAARAGPAHPRAAPPLATPTRRLALGTRHRRGHRDHPHHPAAPPATRLSSTNPSLPAGGNPREPRHRRDSRPTTLPSHQNHRKSTIKRAGTSTQIRPVKYQG